MAFTAFQRNAFQNSAFQIRTGDIGGAIVVHRSGTPFTKRRYRKLIDEIEAEVESRAPGGRARGGAGQGSGAQGGRRGEGAAEGRA